MSFHLFKEFNVDIWLCYGSFFYGFESTLYDCDKKSIALSILTNSVDESKQIESFFETIMEKPKGLLRAELRLYGPTQMFKKLKIETPVYLFTDDIPKAIEKIHVSPILHFDSVQGISQSNTENWLKLLHQIGRSDV